MPLFKQYAQVWITFSKQFYLPESLHVKITPTVNQAIRSYFKSVSYYLLSFFSQLTIHLYQNL